VRYGIRSEIGHDCYLWYLVLTLEKWISRDLVQSRLRCQFSIVQH
jgi:hypothetical protein